MAKVTSLREAVAELVRDGDAVALEGFTHLIPTAGAHEIIRQGRRNLTLIRMTPDLIYDQMIGMGCAKKLVFSWGGNPGVGSLHRFRDAIEHGWPEPIEIDEHSHAGMANRYVAGASNLPFAVLRGYFGTDLPKVTSTIAPITCPFTGEKLMAVPALNPDVAIIHAQQADRRGNVAIWGISGIQKEAALSARRVIVTVEEVVEEFEPRPFQVVLPWVAVDAISVVPNGATPPTRTATTTATMPSTRPGTPSVATASCSGRGWRSMFWAWRTLRSTPVASRKRRQCDRRRCA